MYKRNLVKNINVQRRDDQFSYSKIHLFLITPLIIFFTFCDYSTNSALASSGDKSKKVKTFSLTSSRNYSMVNSKFTSSFTDISFFSGIAEESNVELGGHAAIFSDINGDELPDLYITLLGNELKEDQFFFNLGNTVFESQASERGIADLDSGSHGACFADLDNDGDFDLINGTTYGSNSISARIKIYVNDGNGYFTDITGETGIPNREWPTRAVLAFDMDNDSDLDIFAVTNYQGSDDPLEERNEVYRNDGNIKFTPINSGDLFTAPVGQGAIDTDYDNDGDVDIFAANRTGDLNVLKNDGTGNFSLIVPSSIGIKHQARDGISMGDIDNDGDLDMILKDSDGFAHLYKNLGSGTFSLTQSFTIAGYMAGFADLDNDGDLDMIFPVGDGYFLNDGVGNFSLAESLPVNEMENPRAIAFSDIDDDGDMDIAIACKRSRNFLLKNNFDSGNWLKVKLISQSDQIGAFGARTYIHPVGGIGGTIIGMREARSNNGYLAQNDPILHFGLGEYSQVDVVTKFLDGSEVIKTQVQANQTIIMKPVPPIPGTIFSITGTCSYFSNDSTILATKVSLSGDLSESYLTPASGIYSFDSIPALSNVYLHASKSIHEDVGVISILSYDATLAARFAVGSEHLSENQQLAADVDKNNEITSYDAAAIARYAVSLPPLENTYVGEWKFQPDFYRINFINEDISDKNFTGILLGDVKGGWDSNDLEKSKTTNQVLLNDFVETNVSLNQDTVNLIFQLPVERSVFSFDIWLNELSNDLEFQNYKILPEDLDWNIISNSLPDKFRIGGHSIHLSNQDYQIQLKFLTKPHQTSHLFSIQKFIINNEIILSNTDFATSVLDKNKRIPNSLSVFQNYPNPFNSETNFTVHLLKQLDCKITVYNLAGEYVDTIFNGTLGEGIHNLIWNFENGDSHTYASGIYIIRCKLGSETKILKTMVLK